MNKKQIHIIGGGFSGMTLAWCLARQNFEVHLYERQNRLGGMIQTRFNDFGQAESAANAILLSDLVLELFADIGFTFISPLKNSKKRFIFRGRPRQWPLNFIESLILLPKLLKVLVCGKKILRPQALQSVSQWSDRNFSKTFTSCLLGPALQGIYAGDVTQLSASLIFGGLFHGRGKSKVSKMMVSGEKGMEELVEKLSQHLLKQGVEIHLGESVCLEKLQGPIVIATSVRQAQNILQHSHPELSQSLQAIETAAVVTVTSYWKNSPPKYQGFGVLVPSAAGLKTLGLLMNSCIFPFRSRFHSETYIFGGPLHPEVLSWSDEQIRQKIVEERRQILHTETELLHFTVSRWTEGLPQYNLSLERVLSKLKLPKSIYLHGNYLGQIGLTKILARSLELSKEIGQKELHG